MQALTLSAPNSCPDASRGYPIGRRLGRSAMRTLGSAALFLATLGTLGTALPGFAQFAASDPNLDLLYELEQNPAIGQAAREAIAAQIDSGFSQFSTVNDVTAAKTSDTLDQITDKGSGTLAKSDPDLTNPTYTMLEGLKMAATERSPLELRAVDLLSEAEQAWVVTKCGAMTPCALPQNYDVRARRIYTYWTPSDGTDLEEIRSYFDGSDQRFAEVFVNGRKFDRAADWGLPGDYLLWVTEGAPCHPVDRQPCVVMMFHREKWYETATPPWGDWEIRIDFSEIVEQEQHEIAFDNNGSPIVVREKTIISESSLAIITSKPELKNFWVATMGRTIASERCTSCHSLETTADFSQRHYANYPTPHLVPSIIVEGMSVNHCKNCHEDYVPSLSEDSSFAERRWATPTPELDINWAQIINDNPDTWPIEICNRIVNHLPTHAARAEHFHEDARLHWAVESGLVPYDYSLPTAFPHSYAAFIQQFDAWNDNGAFCPE